MKSSVSFLYVQGKPSSSSVAVSPGASSTFSFSPGSYSTQKPGSTSVHSDLYTPSPASVEVSSDIAIKDNVDSNAEFSGSGAEVNQALRRLEMQLSLNDDLYQEMGSLSNHEIRNIGDITNDGHYSALLLNPDYNSGHTRFQDYSSTPLLQTEAGQLTVVKIFKI